ncbi:type II secretion system GspH family protein [Patescibacteria group bacterium]|nr:type II secretion system GspH family protein [Patescibacteria group bacterium]MBU1682322.1 type II secretion system GspH family protein [Patescibacteria group bacterium]MBU1935480.1 type II secretion system GspH family protein [Patescibacteria group bacterium]
MIDFTRTTIKKFMLNKTKKAFTLIELLIVVGIIMILAGIVLFTVNPAVQFGKANDSERKTEISAIANAINQYSASPHARGALPECLLGATPTATAIPECDTDGLGIGVGNGGFEGAVELGTPGDADTYDCSSTLIPSFLREIPIDPDSAYDETATGYYICQDTTGLTSKIYVIAVEAEVFTDDGGCEVPGSTTPTMCVSG